MLMWDEFKDHPMRKDYVPPADDDTIWSPRAAKRGAAREPETANLDEIDRAGSGGAGRGGAVAPVNAEGEQLLEISMGPHHPSTHGVFRMDVVLDGERVVRLKPVFGYLHRNHEKIAEKADLSGLDALHRPAGLFLFADQQLGLRAGGGEAGGHAEFRSAPSIFA